MPSRSWVCCRCERIYGKTRVACVYTSFRLLLLGSSSSSMFLPPPFCKAKMCECMGAWIPLGCYTLFTPKGFKRHPTSPWYIRMWLLKFSLVFLSFFSCVFIPFHHVRPLLYKGHSIGLFWIQFHSSISNTNSALSVPSKWVSKPSSISWQWHPQVLF